MSGLRGHRSQRFVVAAPLGGLELSGPLVGATVYPGGVVIVSVLMPPFALNARGIVASECRRTWTTPGCEIVHTSAQIAPPIRLRRAETDPIVAALRSLVTANTPSSDV